MKFEEFFLLIIRPWLLVDGGVEVIVPPFPALLACTFGNVVGLLEFGCDEGPVVEAKLIDQFRDGLIFLNRDEGYLQVPWLSIHLMCKLYLFIAKGYEPYCISRHTSHHMHLFISFVQLALFYPFHQRPYLIPTRLHTLTVQKNYQEFVLTAWYNFLAGCSQTGTSIGGYACFYATPTLTQHFIRICPAAIDYSFLWYMTHFIRIKILFISLSYFLFRSLIWIVVGLCIDYFSKDGIFHGKSAEFSKIISSGKTWSIGKTVRIGQIGVGQTDFPTQTIHLSEICSNRSGSLFFDIWSQKIRILKTFPIFIVVFHRFEYAAPYLSNHGRGIVATWQHHAVI